MAAFLPIVLYLVLLVASAVVGESCLHKKGLVKVDLIGSDILKNHNEPCDEKIKNFQNPLLGYVTPWNPKGKEMAKLYASKFDLISPVWYNIDVANDKYFINGENNYDWQFLSDVKAANANVKIVPRFNFERAVINKYYHLSGEAEARQLSEIIVKFAK